jgi:hypothetical protein
MRASIGGKSGHGEGAEGAVAPRLHHGLPECGHGGRTLKCAIGNLC